MDQPDLPFIAYEHTWPTEEFISRAPPQRAWMDATPNRFAYRCLPLVIANQAGWMMESLFTFQAQWDGSDSLSGIRVQFLDGPELGDWKPERFVVSHFGCGVLTFNLPFLFRTPPGYNLWLNGPANWFKDGINPLEGMIETDWAHATFTMNWKFTRANHVIQFDRGDPICQLVPFPRGMLESILPEIRHVSEDPRLAAALRAWAEGRGAFIDDLKVPDSDARKTGWQKDYHQGRSIEGEKQREHQTHLKLREFRRVVGESEG